MAIDPGKTTGFAEFSTEEGAKPLNIGEIPEEHFAMWVQDRSIDTDIWVVENYIINPKMFKHQWDRGDTLRKIGFIEGAAYIRASKFILQQPSQKPSAYKIAGMEYKKGKQGMHIYDAIAHGCLYLAKNYGIVRENIDDELRPTPKSY
jgi:hypothetical protein